MSTTDIQRCLSEQDFSGLQAIGMKSGFTSNNATRLRCYAMLLGCGTDFDIYDTAGEGRLATAPGSPRPSKHKYTLQIAKDIQRNGYSSWTKTAAYSECQRAHDLSQIQKLLNTVFAKYPEFHYSQSLDSVFAAFYLLSNGNLFIAQKLVVQYLLLFRSELILHEFQVDNLKLIWSVLRKEDAKFCKWLISTVGSEEHVGFALKWYISWFTHSSITDFDLILRMFDVMLSSQSSRVDVYMIVAVLLTHKRGLMAKVSGPGELVLFIHSLHFDAESVAAVTKRCGDIVKKEAKRSARVRVRSRVMMKIRRASNAVVELASPRSRRKASFEF